MGPSSTDRGVAGRLGKLPMRIASVLAASLVVAALGCQGSVRRSFADDDGVPEMSGLAIVDSVLFVTLQRLDRNDLFAPNGNGVVVAIDTDTDAVLGAISLVGENPFSRTVLRNGQLLLSTVGTFTERDGGIEAIDVVERQSLGFVVTEEELGGDVTDFVVVSDEIAFAVVSGDDFRNRVIEFSPTTREVKRTLVGGSSFVSQLQLTETGELYVADRSFATPGLRVFDVRSGAEFGESPLELGLPPFDITFLR